MLDACRESDGLRLGGQRIIVDVERGRTVRDWKPKRLGGGRRSAAPRAPPSFNRGSGGGRGPSDYNRRMRSPMRNRSRSPKRTKYN